MQGMQGNCNNAEILLITVQDIQETEFGVHAGQHTPRFYSNKLSMAITAETITFYIALSTYIFKTGRV